MLIRRNLRLRHILLTTWKLDILMIVMGAATYYLHEVIITDAIELPTALATLLGTAIAFFVGFNNNQAYDRWWEARTIWGGLVNDSRTWARNIVHNLDIQENDGELELLKKRLVIRHLGFVYALKEALRGNVDGYYKRFLTDEEIGIVTKQSNVANGILSLNARALQRLCDSGVVDGFRFIQMNDMLTLFTDHMGKCERIKNTVFPTTYVFYTKLFIFILTIFITLILGNTIGAWSILIGWIFGFIFHITHQNGMYLMNPFEEIPTGIPLNQIARTIEINLLEMLGEENIPAPNKPINDEYFL